MPRPDLDAIRERSLRDGALAGDTLNLIAYARELEEKHRKTDAALDVMLKQVRELEAEVKRKTTLPDATRYLVERRRELQADLDAARAELAQRTPSTELADYHPETGHLHTCTALITNATDLVARCVCAARLYCVAQDAELAQRGEVVGWVVVRDPRDGMPDEIASWHETRQDAERESLALHNLDPEWQGRYFVAEVRALAGEGES